MDVEARLLLYVVALGSGVGLYRLLRLRAFSFWFHLGVLSALLTAALVGLLAPTTLHTLAVPAFVAFMALAMTPSLLLLAARQLVSARYFGAAAALVRTSAVLLGLPVQIRREASLYAALAAGERGDEQRAARLLGELADAGALPESQGGRLLAEILPPAAVRRWAEVLARIDRRPSAASPVRVIEARAAAETGDLARALDACLAVDSVGGAATLRAQARRWVLAAAGRHDFLSHAAESGLSVTAGPAGVREVVLARAWEAAAELTNAERAYVTATRRARGSIARDARDGLERVRQNVPRLAVVEPKDEHRLDEIERRCRSERASTIAAFVRHRYRATVIASVVTLVASVLVFFVLGTGVEQFLAAGALSAPLIAGEAQWFRLFTTMLLHAGWVHLLLNIASILIVGIPLERRIGPVRLLVVYLGSGVLASIASVYVNSTAVGVGASGAAMGLMGALGVVIWKRPDTFVSIQRARWGRLLVAGLLATVAIGVAEWRYIDNAAHAGGCVAGALLVWPLLPPRDPSKSLPRWPWPLAVALVFGLAVSVLFAVRQAPEWLRNVDVRTSGASVRLPEWLHTRPGPNGGLVAARPPGDVAILIGADPVAVDALVLLPAGSALREIFLREQSAAPEGVVGRALRPRDDAESDRLGPEFAHGFRLHLVRADRAFALLLVPVMEHGNDDAHELVELVERSLRADP